MPTAAERDRAKKGIKARNDAIQALIKAHQKEFDDLHTKNRVDLGLPPRSAGPTREELEERIRRQEERLEKWKSELRLAS